MTTCGHQHLRKWACWALQHMLSTAAHKQRTFSRSMRKQTLSPTTPHLPSIPRSPLSTTLVPSNASSGLLSSSSEQHPSITLTHNQRHSDQPISAYGESLLQRSE